MNLIKFETETIDKSNGAIRLLHPVSDKII